MKKALILALLGTALAGCGADLDTTAFDPDPLPAGVEDPHPAAVIGVIDWQGEQITFHDISGAGDTVPAILTTYLGPSSRPELSVLLDQQAQFEPTPAEIWRAVKGDADIPEELLAQHAWQVADEGRPEGFQDFDLDHVDVEKAAPNFSTMFPLNTTATGLADPSNRCWGDGVLMVFSNQFAASLCSANGSGLRLDRDIKQFPCDPVLNVNETIRTGAFNPGGGGAYFSKTCGATGNPGTWSCTSPFNHNPGIYFASTTAKNGQQHRMGTGSFAPAGGLAVPKGFLGSAILATGVRRFENTSCNGFFQNF